MDDNNQSSGTSAAASSRPDVLPAQERRYSEELKAEEASLAENMAALDREFYKLMEDVLHYDSLSPKHLRDKFKEDIAALRLDSTETMDAQEFRGIVEPALRFVHGVRAHLRAQEEKEEEDRNTRGIDSDPSEDDKPPEPPRVLKRRFSSCLKYVCSWYFVVEVLFLILMAALLSTLFRQLFLQPSDYASRQQRYRSEAGGNRASRPPFQPSFASRPPRPPPPPNYYAILDIDPDATDRTIRAAYRRQARIHHPDKVHASNARPSAGDGSSGWAKNKTAEERMRLITAAYRTLSGGEDRCSYDYHEYPRSEGARFRLSSADRLRKYYACQRKVRGRLFAKAHDKGGDGGGGDYSKKKDAESPVGKGNEENVEQKVKKPEAKKKQEEDRKGGTAAAKQETALEEQTDPAWQRYLRLVEKAAEGTGEAYHTLCYGDAVARTGLFALQQAIAWKFGVEVPDVCLGGGG